MMRESTLRGLFPAFALLTALLLMAGCKESSSSEKQPTVIVVDAETGESIEGAVAMAVWRKRTWQRWFEGGELVVERIEEAVSDKEGKVYVEGFWDWRFHDLLRGNDKDLPVLDRSPSLTIYKPGYICWDRYLVYLGKITVNRLDFSKEERIARMKKWPYGAKVRDEWETDDYSFTRHEGFIFSVTGGDYFEAPQRLFQEAFWGAELGFQTREAKIRLQKNKEMEEKKKGGR